jgi:hypothetical protein
MSENYVMMRPKKDITDMSDILGAGAAPKQEIQVPLRPEEKIIAKKAAVKKMEKAIPEKIDTSVDKKASGSNKAALANLGLQMAGMKTDNAAGGGLSGGLQAASMTGNPYIIAGAAVLGAVQGEAQRKAQEKKLQAEALLTGAQAQSAAASQKQRAMAQMGQAFQKYFS